MRASTSASQACGSISLSLAVLISVVPQCTARHRTVPAAIDLPGHRGRHQRVAAGPQEAGSGMVSPERHEAARHLARARKIDILDALDLIGPARSERPYERRRSERPVLAPRRRGEERFTAHYRHPPRPPTIEIDRRTAEPLGFLDVLPIAWHPGASNRRRFVDAVWQIGKRARVGRTSVGF